MRQFREDEATTPRQGHSSPADEHGSNEFAITTADLRNPDYDTAPLLAWLGADWIANGYRVISEYRVAIPQSSTATGARQLADTPILESA